MIRVDIFVCPREFEQYNIPPEACRFANITATAFDDGVSVPSAVVDVILTDN